MICATTLSFVKKTVEVDYGAFQDLSGNVERTQNPSLKRSE